MEEVIGHLPTPLAGRELSVSWYGGNRLREMFGNGELFAWHLYRETSPIYETEPFLRELGIPSPYRGGIEDIKSFQTILDGIPAQVEEAPANSIYEMGLLYVCLRNIAMAASWTLREAPDFSRYSPFHLDRVSNVPISREEYDVAMACRLAGQRGLTPPTIEGSQVLCLHAKLDVWISEILSILESTQRDDRS